MQFEPQTRVETLLLTVLEVRPILTVPLPAS